MADCLNEAQIECIRRKPRLHLQGVGSIVGNRYVWPKHDIRLERELVRDGDTLVRVRDRVGFVYQSGVLEPQLFQRHATYCTKISTICL